MPRYTSIAQFRSEATPTEAEEKLIAACRAGEQCILGDGTRPERPSDTRTIRADLLRLLIIGGSAECGLQADGVFLVGAWIEGHLLLRFATAQGQTVLDACHFTNRPRFNQACLQLLSMDKSHLPGLSAQGMVVKGNVSFESIVSTETVDINACAINGHLNFVGANLKAANTML